MLELANSANKWREWGGCGRRGGVEEGRGWGIGAVGTHIAVVTAPVLLRLLLRATIQHCKCKSQTVPSISFLDYSSRVCNSQSLQHAFRSIPPLFNLLALCPIQQGCGCNRALSRQADVSKCPPSSADVWHLQT